MMNNIIREIDKVTWVNKDEQQKIVSLYIYIIININELCIKLFFI